MILRRKAPEAAQPVETVTEADAALPPADDSPPRDRTRRIALIVAVVCIASLVGGGTAAFANDALTRAHLLPGTRIGGVYVGGQSLSEARQKLVHAFVDPLHEPLVLTAADVTMQTTRWDLGMHVDVQSVLQQTYEHQQSMSVWSRITAWVRGVKSGSTSVDPLIDKSVVERTVADLARRVSRPVQDASLSFDGGRLLVVPDRTGRTLDVAAARNLVTTALSDDVQSVQLPVNVTYAEHRTSDFARVIVVHGGSNVLDFYENGALSKSYPVATGQPAYPTPMGQYFVIGKEVNPVWINPHSSWSVGMPEYVPAGPDNPLGTRAMQLDADGIYIHGTPEDDSIGSHASHGCIRMHMSDAEDLFTRVRVGTPVLIVPD
jgi:lipoprotein-anchoring transpeptidase ErfK/SrfK